MAMSVHSRRLRSRRCWAVLIFSLTFAWLLVRFLPASVTSSLSPVVHPTGEKTMVYLREAPEEVENEQEEQNEQQLLHQDLVAAPAELQSFPSVENSTIMFLHVFKCAGTSLREVLTTWAKREGWSGAVVEYCHAQTFPTAGRICLDQRNDLFDPVREKWLVRGTKVLAGHFLWDFRQYVTPPYLMVTTLRNPLELFVSSQQFMHKEETRTLEGSTAFVANQMKHRLGWKDPTDLAFIRRFLDSETANSYTPRRAYPKEEMLAMTQTAVDHLNTFFVVGVVEQYQGFIEVLKRALDPGLLHPTLWTTALGVKDNGSPVHSSEVLRGIDPTLVKEFNSSTLGLQWQVYDVALKLWDQRCREILPAEDHHALCSVRAHR